MYPCNKIPSVQGDCFLGVNGQPGQLDTHKYVWPRAGGRNISSRMAGHATGNLVWIVDAARLGS